MRVRSLFLFLFVFVLSINLVFSCVPGLPTQQIFLNHQFKKCIIVEKPGILGGYYVDANDKESALYALPDGWQEIKIALNETPPCNSYQTVKLDEEVTFQLQNLPKALLIVILQYFPIIIGFLCFFVMLFVVRKSERAKLISISLLSFGLLLMSSLAIMSWWLGYACGSCGCFLPWSYKKIFPDLDTLRSILPIVALMAFAVGLIGVGFISLRAKKQN